MASQMTQSFQTIIYEKQESILRITLNRPEARNAINWEMTRELNTALRQARQDEKVRVIVITGAGTAFSAGLDLKEMWGVSGIQLRKFIESFYWEMTDIMFNLGKPAIAMVNGPTLAAGCTIAFSCDCVIASEKARIGYPEINVGLIAAYHLIHVPRLVGRHKAFELIFTGEPISATEAERIGLINRAVPHEKLEETVNELARKFASKSPLSVKLTREAFYRGLDMEFRKGIADAADVLCILAESEDTKEGMKAFAEKRAPVWKGK